MKNIVRDFWILLLLCYGVIGLNLIKAEETDLAKAMAFVNAGQTDEAIVILRREIEENPHLADAQLLLGVAYMEKEDLESARVALEKALQLNPESLPVRYTLAMLYEKERNYSRALAEWRKVLQLSSDRELKNLAGKHVRHLEKIR